MKSRAYEIYSSISEYNFSGLHSTKMVYLTTIPPVVPTVKNIRSVVRSFFPEYEIDETYETIKSRISSGNEIGMISVPFVSNDDFISRSCVLMEVL